MTVPLARRNLLQSRTRLLVSVGGVALSALLVLALDGVFAGSANQVTVFMDRTPFDVVVSQQGVRNLHMTTSFFPTRAIDEIRAVEGVSSVDPILYTTTFLIAGDSVNQRSLAYLIGYQPERLGGPWEWSGAPLEPDAGDIIVDEALAEDMGLKIGDTLTAAGSEFTVAGFDRDTMSIINSIAFVSYEGFERAQDVADVASFALVTAEPGVAAEELSRRIADELDGVTVQTREEFARNERRIVSDMSIDIMRMMNLIAFIIGLAVTALAVYTATLAKVREYGVMKALGVRNGSLYLVVAKQAAMTLGIGLLLGVALTYALQEGLGAAQSRIPLDVELASVARVLAAASVLGVLSAVLPVIRIARLKPADVFRR